MTRKYPFYVWHASKRLNSLARMDQHHEVEESKYINLFSSDYVREAIDSVYYALEHKKQASAQLASQNEPAGGKGSAAVASTQH